MSAPFSSRRKKRTVLSFLLYLCLSLSVVCVGFISVGANPNVFIKEFTDNTYVENVKADAVRYTQDMCLQNSIPDDFVDDVITHNRIMSLQKAYITAELNSTEEYNKSTYDGLLTKLQEDIEASVGNMVAEQNIQIDPSVKKTAVADFSEQITDYIGSIIHFNYISQLRSYCDTANMFCKILLCFCVIAIAVIVLALNFSTSRKYRASRAIAYSILAAAIMNTILFDSVAIVKDTKKLVIYPTYLVDVFMNWVDDSLAYLLASTGFLVVLFAAVTAITWMLKNNSKQ
ncbi:hypothetical protein [Eubacterium sp.]|uniref:hypothetical protein n=1 Tax=Eubacterium sp. TaxID=142586 RepID=UPI003F0BDBEE